MEIFTSEQTYVQSLEELYNLYLKPLRKAVESGSPIISAQSIDAIFCNVEEITKIGYELLKMLEDRLSSWKERQTIADAFICLVPHLEVYGRYCANYTKAIICLVQKSYKENFKAFLKKAGEQGQYVAVQSYLILPVQRIPRYKLLLTELLKMTPPGHVDSVYLAESVEKISELAVKINETIREQEQLEELIAIQKQFTGNPPLVAPSRAFLKEGPVVKICRKSPKPRVFFLFSDCLVYASKVDVPGFTYSFHRMIDLLDTRILDVPDTPNQEYACQILAKEKSFTVCFKDENDKASWISAIKKGIEGLGASKLQTRAPVWIPDKDSPECMVCHVKFTLVLRRHHCRKCGIVVCGKCSTSKFLLEFTGKQSKVCNACFDFLVEEHGGWDEASKQPGLFRITKQMEKQSRSFPPDVWGPQHIAEWCDNVFDGKFAPLKEHLPKKGSELLLLTKAQIRAMIDKSKIAGTGDAAQLAGQFHYGTLLLRKRSRAYEERVARTQSGRLAATTQSPSSLPSMSPQQSAVSSPGYGCMSPASAPSRPPPSRPADDSDSDSDTDPSSASSSSPDGASVRPRSGNPFAPKPPPKPKPATRTTPPPPPSAPKPHRVPLHEPPKVPPPPPPASK